MNNNIKDFQIFGITGYTVMSTYHLRDPNLSLKAKGLLSLMLSLPKSWDYSINGLVTIAREGRSSIKSILNELKEAEYVKIDKLRDEKGLYKYKYSVYYLPYPKWLKMRDYPEIDFPSLDKREVDSPDVDNHQQIKIEELKNNNKIDKLDKMKIQQEKHNILTMELINLDYISEDDVSSFYFDDLFQELLNEGNNYKNLLTITHYIINRVKDRNYMDENDMPIQNRFGYFKNSILSNISKFNNYPNELYPELDDYELWNSDDKEDDFEL